MSGGSHEQRLLELLREGDEGAAWQVFTAYANRLLQLARARMSPPLARRVDPEDIVQSAFRTFFSRARAGQFTIEGDHDLAKILVGITLRKALRQVAFHKAAKRDPRLEEAAGLPFPPGLPDPLAVGPSPEAAVAFADLLEHLLSRLHSGERAVLEMRLQGYRQEEIARQLGTTDRQVRRAFKHIRAVAEQEELSP
jgi:RNA polymerase sigma-70 factor (ECF subfamily)